MIFPCRSTCRCSSILLKNCIEPLFATINVSTLCMDIILFNFDEVTVTLSVKNSSCNFVNLFYTVELAFGKPTLVGGGRQTILSAKSA